MSPSRSPGPAVVLAWSSAFAVLALVVTAMTVSTGAQPWKLVLVPAAWAVPGVLIAAGRPGNPVGWLLLIVAGLFATAALGTEWVEAGHTAGAEWGIWLADRFAVLLVPATLGVLLLLPDGDLPGPRWRPVATAVIGVQLGVCLAWILVAGSAAAPDSTWPVERTNPVGVLPSWLSGVLDGLDVWVLQLPLLLGVVAVVARMRQPDQRRRLAGLLIAVAVFVLLVVLGRELWPTAADVLDVVGAALLAAGLTAAVLRRRLSEVELVIHHALVYAVLTALIAAAYVIVVALAGAAGHELPPFGVGLVCGAIALALLPLRGRLQRLLDWSLYGDTHRPYRAVRRLADSVGDATNVDAFASGLARAVAASLRAAWVRVEIDGHVAESGRPVGGPAVTGPLTHGDLRLGSLTVALRPGRTFRPRDNTLLDDLCDHAGRALHAVLLADALLTNRQLLVTAREDERSRLRRDLHDELGPTLAGLAMQLSGLRQLLRTDPAVAAERVARLEAAARHALEDVRRVSRSLRPPALDDLGLSGALAQVAEDAGLSVDLHHTAGPLPPAVEVAVYRIGTEAILNVARHTECSSVAVSVDRRGDRIVLSVRDTGLGIDGATAGVGILSMRERAEELGGRLDIGSATEAGRSGTTVTAVLPCADVLAEPEVST